MENERQTLFIWSTGGEYGQKSGSVYLPEHAGTIGGASPAFALVSDFWIMGSSSS